MKTFQQLLPYEQAGLIKDLSNSHAIDLNIKLKDGDAPTQVWNGATSSSSGQDFVEVSVETLLEIQTWRLHATRALQNALDDLNGPIKHLVNTVGVHDFTNLKSQIKDVLGVD